MGSGTFTHDILEMLGSWKSSVWVLFFAVTLCCCMNSATGISIEVIPKDPKVRSNVTLSVTGVTGQILFYDWYKGQSADAAQQILKYYNNQNINGSKYFPQAHGQPNGSLVITDVRTDLSGYYTVSVQTRERLQQGSVLLTVNGAVTIGLSPVTLLFGVLLFCELFLRH